MPLLRIGIFALTLVLAAGCIAAPRPFRIHESDVRERAMDGAVWKIRCTVCAGHFQMHGIDPYTRRPIFCPGCGGQEWQDTRFLGRSVQLVPDDERTDYPDP